MDKKGFIRILEATISILIVIAFLFVYVNKAKATNSVDFSETARDTLEELAKNSAMRQEVLSYQFPSGSEPFPEIPSSIQSFVSSRVPTYMNFEIRICEIDSPCGMSAYVQKNIYSAERVISSTLLELEPKKIRLFLWEK